MKPEWIIVTVSTVTGITVGEMRGRSRKARIVLARHAAMYLLHTHTDLSYPAIARLFDRDHTTVMHAVARIEGARRANTELDRLLDEAVA